MGAEIFLGDKCIGKAKICNAQRDIKVFQENDEFLLQNLTNHTKKTEIQGANTEKIDIKENLNGYT